MDATLDRSLEEKVTDRRGWSVKKEINIGEIIYAVVILTSMLLYVSRIDTKTDLNTRDIDTIHATDARQDAERQLSDTEHRDDYNRLNDKLDKILEEVSTGRKR